MLCFWLMNYFSLYPVPGGRARCVGSRVTGGHSGGEERTVTECYHSLNVTLHGLVSININNIWTRKYQPGSTDSFRSITSFTKISNCQSPDWIPLSGPGSLPPARGKSGRAGGECTALHRERTENCMVMATSSRPYQTYHGTNCSTWTWYMLPT